MSEIEDDIGHSIVGASSSPRWMNCSGSNQLVAKIIDKYGQKEIRSSGFAAAEGTAAHDLLARCLNEGVEPWEKTGEIIQVEDWSGFPVNEDMTAAVHTAYAHVNEAVARHWREDPVIYVEKSVRHPDHPDLFGTLDFGLVVHKAKKVYIKDYKHGIGVNVEPTSPQLKYYALVMLADLFRSTFESMLDYEVELTIMQPRQPHHKGPIRHHHTTVRELLVWFKDELLPAYELTKDPAATLKVGEWCGFCPARDHCPAIKAAAFSIDTTVEPEELTDEEVGDLLRMLKPVKKYMENMEELALKRVKAGRVIPGQKLVKKRANRVLKEGAGEAAVKEFGDEAWQPHSIKSPPMLEKLDGGQKFVSKWAYSPDTGYTLAPETDKREAVKPLMDDFLDRVDAPVDV